MKNPRLPFFLCAILCALPLLAQTAPGAFYAPNGEPDTDRDGFSDFEEIRLGLDPFDPADGLFDEDGDGLTLAEEVHAGTNPKLADSDYDGVNDREEILIGSDPLDPSSPFRAGGVLYYSKAVRKPLLPTTPPPPRATLAVEPEPDPLPPPVEAYRTTSLRYYYPVPGSSHGAFIHEIARLTPGAYVIFWKHRAEIATNRKSPPYRIELRNARTGRVYQSWVSPFPVGETTTAHSLAFSVGEVECRDPVTISLTPTVGVAWAYYVFGYELVKVGLEADLDRNGVISTGESPSPAWPLRVWVNDDADEDEWQERADVPALAGERQDAQDWIINGLRDLVDFFPVNLSLRELLWEYPTDNDYVYYLRQRDRALGYVWTSLHPRKVSRLHREPDLEVFGPQLNDGLAAARVESGDAEGKVRIPDDFLERIRRLGHGVVLVEGRRVSNEPLELVIMNGGSTVMTVQMPLRVVPVETMYRHLNATGFVEDSGKGGGFQKPTGGRPTQLERPAGLPDAELGNRYFFLVHGYNVSADSARGWHAETFKRLHAMGSRARFVGVTWDGDTGLDYHKAVFHALQTGEILHHWLRSIAGDQYSVIAAHSLGNAVVARSVEAGYAPSRYLMLNAAIPVESVSSEDVKPEHSREMVEEDWRPYEERLYASHWWKKFPPGSRHRALTWIDAFRRVKTSGVAVNYYSGGEDITVCPQKIKSASVLSALWARRSLDYGAWKMQELLKGVDWTRSLGSLVMRRDQAGWGFNWAWRGEFIERTPGRPGGYYERLTPEEAARINDADLFVTPFFRPFISTNVGVPSTANLARLPNLREIDRYEALATGIPAISYAAGGVSMEKLTELDGKRTDAKNFSLEASGRTPGYRWPTTGHMKDHEIGHWLHSDFKNVALPFVYPFYSSMIFEGKLR